MTILAEILPHHVVTGGPYRWPVVRRGERDPIPWLVRLAVYIRDDFRCERCGRRDETMAGLEPDHCVPWSAGGADDATNLRTLCRGCNRRRSNLLDSSHGRRRFPVTWWCEECWPSPEPRPVWRDGTDLNACPPAGTEVLAFCAWCRTYAYTERLATQWTPTRGME